MTTRAEAWEAAEKHLDICTKEELVQTAREFFALPPEKQQEYFDIPTFGDIMRELTPLAEVELILDYD